MYCFYADDGKILTPPNELKPQLKDAFPAFYKLLGHLRWFYMADEIWDGKSTLVFNVGGGQLAAVVLVDGAFHVHLADEVFQITNETMLEPVFLALNKAPSDCRRPLEQRTVNGCPCGRRCDLCLGSKEYCEDGFSEGENFGYMDWVCYNKVCRNTKRSDGVFKCPGCEDRKGQNCCKYFICLTDKGYTNCVECGEYHSCDTFLDCHHPAQCNLGITAEEVTKLVIPYAMRERLDTLRKVTS